MPKRKQKSSQSRRQTRRRRPTTTSHSSQTQAIVRVAAPTERPWGLDNQQVVLLKNYLKIADASDTELAGCLEVDRRYRLDPFKQGQIWFVKRWDKNAISAAGTKGGFVYTPQVGIYGMLHIAARDHADYGSISETEFGPMFMHEVEGHKFKAPEWCRVKAFKKGIAEPTVATIYFEEFCPALWDNARLFWARMPRAQIEKCCKARVVRTAYPDLGGLTIPEEMDRFKDEYTESGRQIIETATQGTHLGTKQAAQAVLAAKLAGTMPLNPEIVTEAVPVAQDPLSWKKEAEKQADAKAAKPAKKA